MQLVSCHKRAISASIRPALPEKPALQSGCSAARESSRRGWGEEPQRCGFVQDYSDKPAAGQAVPGH